MAESRDMQRAIPVSWDDVDSVPIVMANQFLLQADPIGLRPDLFVLTAGQTLPPPLLGTQEEREAAAEQIQVIKVRALGRYSLTEGRLNQLIELLVGARATMAQAAEALAAAQTGADTAPEAETAP